MPDLKQISELIDGNLKGDPQTNISGVNSLYKADQKQIAFSIKDDIPVECLKAGALIVGKQSTIQYPNLIYVAQPYLAFAALLNYFFPSQPFNEGIDPAASIAETAHIGQNVNIGAFACVGERCQIGDHTNIHAGVIIYPDVKIGKNCLIYANVVIREEVEIGDNVIIQPGAVIGSDGFGFTRLPDGTPVKIPQKGKVVIGNHCEIGANTCIDRSTIEETVLRDYVKLDNLIQIGHNCKIGRGTAISALTGISGSVEVGDNVIMGGQVGLVDHIKIADEVMIVAQSGITGNIKTKSIIAGSPHQEFGKWKKSYAIFRNLEKYIDKIKELEKKIKELEEK
jgi:UDP-3-O-[3-hydroxymyristoyl] glucosamine N-acyltransferase